MIAAEVRGEPLAEAARVEADAAGADDAALRVDPHPGVRPRGMRPGRAPRRGRRECLVQARGRDAGAGGGVALILERREQRRVDEPAAAGPGRVDRHREVAQERRRGDGRTRVAVQGAQLAVGPEAGEPGLDVLDDPADRGGVAFEHGPVVLGGLERDPRGPAHRGEAMVDPDHETCVLGGSRVWPLPSPSPPPLCPSGIALPKLSVVPFGDPVPGSNPWPLCGSANGSVSGSTPWPDCGSDAGPGARARERRGGLLLAGLRRLAHEPGIRPRRARGRRGTRG